MIDNYFQDDYQPSHNVYQHPKYSNCIFLGDISSALNLDFIRQSNIKTVVTAATGMDHVQYQKQQINHIVYELLDAKNENIAKLFAEFYRLVEAEIPKGSILVHCAAGISRSATLVISYLMKKEGWTFKDAIQFIRKKRRTVCPNLGFERQLKHYQKMLKNNEVEFEQDDRKLVSKTSDGKKHSDQQKKIEKLPQIAAFGNVQAKSKIIDEGRMPNNSNSNHLVRNGYVNISFYSNQRNARLQPKYPSRQQEAKYSNSINFKIRGIKNNYSEIKKKESSISHRSDHQRKLIQQSRNFTQNNVRKTNKKFGIGEFNHFQVIKLNIYEKKMITQKVLQKRGIRISNLPQNIN